MNRPVPRKPENIFISLLHFMDGQGLSVSLRVLLLPIMMVLLAIGGSMWAIQQQMDEISRLQIRAVGDTLSDQIVSSVSAPLGSNDLLSLQVTLDTLKRNPLVRHAAIYSIDKKLLAEVGTPANKSIYDSNATEFNRPITLMEVVKGQLYLDLNSEHFNAPVTGSLQILALLGGLLLMLTWILGRRLGNQLTLPLLQLQQWVRNPEDQAPACERHDEIGDLARQLQHSLAPLPVEPEEHSSPLDDDEILPQIDESLLRELELGDLVAGAAPQTNPSVWGRAAPGPDTELDDLAPPPALASMPSPAAAPLPAPVTTPAPAVRTPPASNQQADSFDGDDFNIDLDSLIIDFDDTLPPPRPQAPAPRPQPAATATLTAPPSPTLTPPGMSPAMPATAAPAPLTPAAAPAPARRPQVFNPAEEPLPADFFDVPAFHPETTEPAPAGNLHAPAGASVCSAVLAVQLGNQDELRQLPHQRLLMLLQRYRKGLEDIVRYYQGSLYRLDDGGSLVLFHSSQAGEPHLQRALCCAEQLRSLGLLLQGEIADSGLPLQLQLALSQGEGLYGQPLGTLLRHATCLQVLELRQHSYNQLLLDNCLGMDPLVVVVARLRQLPAPVGALAIDRLLDPWPARLHQQLSQLLH